MTKTVSVAAINNGTVIDHIESGQAMHIINMLKLLEKKLKVTVGLNLPSQRSGLKDLIKIENHEITSDEADKVTIFSPHATINLIREYEVTKKIKTKLPESISSVFVCPNKTCISHSEPVEGTFKIIELAKLIKLVCRYCEKSYQRNEVGVRAC